MPDVTMPQLGETVTEGTITKWFKAVGDTVARDEPLFEVSTDKVDSEVPSPADGVLTAILVEELKKRGHDGLVYQNLRESDTEDHKSIDPAKQKDSYIILHPDQVRPAI